MIFRVTNSVGSLPALRNDEAWTVYLAGKGYAVNSVTALKVATVIRCVDVVAKTIASLPCEIYQEEEDGKKLKAKSLPLYKLLHRLPNPETTAYEFWHMYVFNLMLTSGAYAKIVRTRQGVISALWNIPTAAVKLDRNKVNNERYIDVYLENGQTERLREGEFMYTPGLRLSNVTYPEDPLKIAADVLGLTMALNGFAYDFFRNGANLGGVVEVPGKFSELAYDRFKLDWQRNYEGVLNQHKTAILEEGAKFNKLDSKLVDAQALESRKFEVIEICRLFGVPPHKVFELDRATFSNIEEMNTEFVQEAIVPRSVMIEQTIYKDLLTLSQQVSYYAKFNTNGLLRGNMAARSTYYHNGRNDGWLSTNDIRALEDMDKIDESKGGDEYAVNGNMIPLSSVSQNLPKGATK